LRGADELTRQAPVNGLPMSRWQVMGIAPLYAESYGLKATRKGGLTKSLMALHTY